MNRILHDANNAQRILKLTADTMLLVDRHGVCVDIEPHCDLWFLQEDILLGKNIFGHNISFYELVKKLNLLISINQDEFNIFSFDGLIKSFITINLFNLIFSYALRFVIIKVFILITPFSILSLINNSTSWFFKTWFKTIFSLLLQQSFISIILLIIFSFNYSSNDTISKLMYIGGIYALVRANSYMQHLIGGISTDISNNFNISNKLFKNI